MLFFANKFTICLTIACTFMIARDMAALWDHVIERDFLLAASNGYFTVTPTSIEAWRSTGLRHGYCRHSSLGLHNMNLALIDPFQLAQDSPDALTNDLSKLPLRYRLFHC
jgi:hypothetical protein